MRIEFDTAKNERNIRERGLSFEQVAEFDFETALIETDDRHDYGEAREEKHCVSSVSARQMNARCEDMSKRPDPELVDDENPELTDEWFKRAKRFTELPETLQTVLSRRPRGPQKAPIKERITIRLSPEVVEPFRATGDGWQTRLDAALKDWLKTHTPT